MSITLTLAHSPDPDDVFMWWPITGMIEAPTSEDAQKVEPARVVGKPEIDTKGIVFTPIAADIAALNRRGIAAGDLDITALSVFAWSKVAEKYALTSFGGSFGEHYGPKVVTRRGMPTTTMAACDKAAKVAVPGTQTTAFLLLSMLLGRDAFTFVEMPFDRILDAVKNGEQGVTHGLLIHQSQLTYPQMGLELVVDLGEWWGLETGLPLPLGGNAVKRDLDERFGAGTRQTVVDVMRASIAHALKHKQRSAEYCLRFAPELTAGELDRYLEMYVSELTIDAGPAGETAIRRVVSEAQELGMGPAIADDLVRMLRPG